MPRRVLLGALIALFVLSLPGAASAAIKIVKIHYDAPGRDGRSNLDQEFVVITNTGNRRVDLTGWKLHDANSHVYVFGTFRLRPGRSVTIHTGRGVDDRNDLYKDSTSAWWNNDRDTATLRRGGELIDRCRYRGGGNGVAAC